MAQRPAVGVHGEGPTQGCGSQGTRGAHVEHALHVVAPHLGRVEAERLVARLRLLPSLAGAAKRSRAAAAKGRRRAWQRRRRAGRRLCGGSGGGDGGGGAAGGGSTQQASSHFAGSDFFLFAVDENNLACISSGSTGCTISTTFFRPFFLHVFRSLNGVQPFGDGAEAKSTGNHSDEFASDNLDVPLHHRLREQLLGSIWTAWSRVLPPSWLSRASAHPSRHGPHRARHS